MSDFPFWAYPAITFGGLAATAGVVYLMAISNRNQPAKKVVPADVVSLNLADGAYLEIAIGPYEAGLLRRVSRNLRTYDVLPSDWTTRPEYSADRPEVKSDPLPPASKTRR